MRSTRRSIGKLDDDIADRSCNNKNKSIDSIAVISYPIIIISFIIIIHIIIIILIITIDNTYRLLSL